MKNVICHVIFVLAILCCGFLQAAPTTIRSAKPPGIAQTTTYSIIIDDQTAQTRTVYEGCLGYGGYTPGAHNASAVAGTVCASSHQEEFEAYAHVDPQFYFVNVRMASGAQYTATDCVLTNISWGISTPNVLDVFLACHYGS